MWTTTSSSVRRSESSGFCVSEDRHQPEFEAIAHAAGASRRSWAAGARACRVSEDPHGGGTGTACHFGAAAFSGRPLRFSLATALLQPQSSPSVVVIDEPELDCTCCHSTPRRADEIGLDEDAAHRPTQSSLLLDEFRPEDVIVTEVENGGTRFERLSASMLGDWLEHYSLGELWEKNEIGGRPR
jgi:hypothetical protein